MNIYYCY